MSENQSRNLLVSVLDTHCTVGEWVAKYPTTLQVLRDSEIDVCIGGFLSLNQAYLKNGSDLPIVLEKLMDAIHAGASPRSCTTMRMRREEEVDESNPAN